MDQQGSGSSRRLRRLAIAGPLLAASLGALAIAGWLSERTVLASFSRAFIPMAPITAIGFVVLGSSAAWLSFSASRRRRLAAGIGAASIFALAAFETTSALAGWSQHVDKLLIADPAHLASVPTGRISPLTAGAFLLAGAGLLALVVERRRTRLGDTGDLAGLLASLLAVVGGVVVLGYFYGAPPLYGGPSVPMALPTALAFAAFSTGLIALGGPTRFPLSALSGDSARVRLLRAFLPIIPVALLVGGAFFRFVRVSDPSLDAILLALLLGVAVSIGVVRASRVVGGVLDQVEAERRARDRAERQDNENARVLLESQRVARLGSYRLDLLSGVWSSSAILDQLFGIVDPAFRKNVPGWLSVIHPEDREAMATYFREEVAARGQAFDREYRIVRLNDGEVRWVHGLGELIADEAGRLTEMIGTIQDVTAIRAAEAEKAAVEAMLIQSQKLEGIGRLAGGVAHDFNNFLSVMTIQGELMRDQLAPEHPCRSRLEQILKAAERAARLTQQLLAFSRRQLLQPRVFDLNAALQDMTEMLMRIVGEDVRIELRQAADLGRVRVDPTQIEQVLMNLVVNARDAMPKGGSLAIETSNADLDEGYCVLHPPTQPGRYVMLAVSDTGVGMDAETQRRVFEPFFTTKPPGQGSGLGLATVYGIVKQSGGYVWAYSELGRGTTFKVYLPRTDAAPEVDVGAADTEAVGGAETILLVEDTAPLRELIQEVLENLGYRVLAAADGEAALALAKSHPSPIDLLLSDVVMPKLSGSDLAARLKMDRPAVAVLLVSGYTDGVLQHHVVRDEDSVFLEKPFTRDSLARAVREALARSRSRAEG